MCVGLGGAAEGPKSHSSQPDNDYTVRQMWHTGKNNVSMVWKVPLCSHGPPIWRLRFGGLAVYALLRRRPRIRIGSVLTDLPTRLFTAHEIAFREYNTLLSHLLVDGFRRVPSSSK